MSISDSRDSRDPGSLPPEPDNLLSWGALLLTVGRLIDTRAAEPALLKAFADAKENLDANQKYQKVLSRALGAHTRQKGQMEIVLAREMAALVPIPSQTYPDDTHVHVKFCQPVGKLQ